MGIKEFYPSIIEETLDTAVSFASNHTTISVEDMRINKRSRKLLLFHLEQTWKRESSSCFDVTMRSYDEAEFCELIGIFSQLVLQDIINKEAMAFFI